MSYTVTGRGQMLADAPHNPASDCNSDSNGINSIHARSKDVLSIEDWLFVLHCIGLTI